MNNKKISDTNDLTSNEYGDSVIKKAINSERNSAFGTTSSNTRRLNYFYSLPNNINIFDNIKNNITIVPDEGVRKLILEFTFIFQNILISYNDILEINNHFPPLMINNSDDGSVLLEWIFKDFRIGFSFEIDSNESSWYLVANKNLEEASMSGLLKASNVNSLLNKLIHFVLRNS